MSAALKVDDLTVVCGLPSGRVIAPVNGVSFEVAAGEIVGLIGESGSGKTTTVRSLIGLLAKNAAVVGGTITVDGETLEGGDRSAFLRVRGRKIGTIFQNAMSSLNPVLRVGRQLDEVLKAHAPTLTKDERHQRLERMLTSLGFTDPGRVMTSYPHQLSGGMRQRVAIGIALAPRPAVLIADESTTALDVTTQAEVVTLLRELVDSNGSGLLFVTHDILLAAEICDRIVVMYGGQVVEQGPVDDVIEHPLHPYTRALLKSVPLWRPRASLVGIQGVPPEPAVDAVGCRFAPRCEYAADVCTARTPDWIALDGGRGHRCARAEAMSPIWSRPLRGSTPVLTE